MRTLLRVIAVLASLAPLGGLAQTATDRAPADPPVEEAQPAAPRREMPAIPSFQRGTGTRAGGPANELNTGDRRATERPSGGDVGATVAGSDLYHGNYCGRGDRGPGLPPVDELDAVCKRHDDCYTRAGRRSCQCDQQLKRDALAVAELRNLSREVRARAASVAEASEVMGCEAP